MFLTLINFASSLISYKWNLYSMYSCYELLHHASLTQSMTDIYASSAAEQYFIVWMYFVSAFSLVVDMWPVSVWSKRTLLFAFL